MSFSSLMPSDFHVDVTLRKTLRRQPDTEQLLVQLGQNQPLEILGLVIALSTAYQANAKLGDVITWQFTTDPAVVRWVTAKHTEVEVALFQYDELPKQFQNTTTPDKFLNAVRVAIGTIVDVTQLRSINQVFSKPLGDQQVIWHSTCFNTERKNECNVVISYPGLRFGYRVSIRYSPIKYLTYGEQVED